MIQHLSEMMLFLNYCIFAGRAEALVRCCGKLQHLLTAYFLGNTRAKHYENPTMFSRVTAKFKAFESYRIIDTQTDRTKIIYHAVSQVVNNDRRCSLTCRGLQKRKLLISIHHGFHSCCECIIDQRKNTLLEENQV